MENNIYKSVAENMLKATLLGEGDSFCLDMLEKGKRAQMGETRQWKDGTYRRTPNGWERVRDNKGGGSSEKPNPKEENPKKPDSVMDELEEEDRALKQKDTDKKQKKDSADGDNNIGDVSDHSSVTKTRLSKYEEKISAEIKKLQERLETAKKQAETTAKIEAAIPDVFKRAGLNLKSTTLILDENNPEIQRFKIEANVPGKFMVKEARESTSAANKAFENALAKSAMLSSMVESFFKEKGLNINASINPYSLQYKDSPEKTVLIDLNISNYGN